ncbi:MAG TPA: hypothetical protein VN226_03460 [Anaerolineales bacterium]|nr:hypothetical protein [Anaerolineales bacterium]
MEQNNHIAFSDELTYSILNFAGYGKVDSDLWILTFDQSLPEDSDLTKFSELGQTTSKPEFLTIFELDGSAFNTKVMNGYGIFLAGLILKLSRSMVTDTAISNLYKDDLFAEDGIGFMVPFYPIPVNPNKTEDFRVRFPLFKSYPDYLSKAKKLRGEFIQELLAQFAPKTVIALMSRESFNDLMDVFPQFHFEDHAGIFAGWDTTTIMLVLDPTLISNDGLERAVKFILENSLPMNLEGKLSVDSVSIQNHLGVDPKKHGRAKSVSKRKNKTKHDPSDPFCVCDECLGY